jgi:Protein of unknown function (DUF3147)
MAAGAGAFLLYACVCSRRMIRGRWHAAPASIATLALMRVSVQLSTLRKTRYEYALRFLFGGATVLAGLVARQHGSVVGGFLLAFPAIFPASATLIEKHERQKKQKAGIESTSRGRQAAGLDAYGAALGSVGLMCFAMVVWNCCRSGVAFVLSIATASWIVISIVLWSLHESCFWRCRVS